MHVVNAATSYYIQLCTRKTAGVSCVCACNVCTSLIVAKDILNGGSRATKTAQQQNVLHCLVWMKKKVLQQNAHMRDTSSE